MSIGTLRLALRIVVALLAVGLLVDALPAGAQGPDVAGHAGTRSRRADPADAAPDPRCSLHDLDDEPADDLLADRYRFLPHRTVSLAWPIDWAADPLDDRNWRFQLHALVWLEPLLARWQRTGDTAARDRVYAVARSWSVANPPRDPASFYAWEAHATALRASILACLAGLAPPPDWLIGSLRRHGRILADPATPVPAGNHALNQAIALLEVGCRLSHDGWGDLAEWRLRRLLPRSVDRTGVADEQSIGYQRYVLVRWRLAQDRLAECGRPPLPGAARLDRMPRLLAFATQPDGRYLRIGDTEFEAAQPIAGTIAEFAATGGASGPEPSSRVARFPAGYLLARTGWGASRAFADEVLLSLRFGPGRFLHGHDDGGALTLYGFGAPLLLDPGFKDYDGKPWRDWFRSRAAHDTVVVDGRMSDEARATRLLRSGPAGAGYEALVRITAIRGVTHDRRVVMSLDSGIVVVEDVLRSRAPITARQLWHLPADAAPRRAGGTVWTRRDRGNITVMQLIGPERIHFVSGRLEPRQGWLSEHWGRVHAAPVVEVVASGGHVRYLTLLVPSATIRPSVSVRDVRLTSAGFAFTVEVAGRAESFAADGDGATVTAIP